MAIYSALYGYVRGRQLEGTFPGDKRTGCWPITAFRVGKGWGHAPEEAWPYDDALKHWPPNEPENIDIIARRKRTHSYQRVRSCNECKIAISQKHPVIFAAEITDSWFNSPNGVIPMVRPRDNIIGSHCVLLIGYDDNKRVFIFQNSWGTTWGDKGYGYLPYDYIDKFIVESWVACSFNVLFPKTEGVTIHNSGIKSVLHSVIHVVDIIYGDDYAAWAFGVQYEDFLNIEELFVMPAFRRRGFSKVIINNLIDISKAIGKPLRFWVSFADSDGLNMGIIRHLSKKYGYKISPAPVRWAQHIIAQEVPKSCKQKAVTVPGIVFPGSNDIPFSGI